MADTTTAEGMIKWAQDNIENVAKFGCEILKFIVPESLQITLASQMAFLQPPSTTWEVTWDQNEDSPVFKLMGKSIVFTPWPNGAVLLSYKGK